MKLSTLPRGLALWLVFSCSLAGCGGKPQPPAASDSRGAGEPGASDQTKAREAQASDQSLDEAGRIMAEAIRRREAPSPTPQTPAGAVLGATPTPPLGARLGVTGQPFNSFGGRFVVTPPPGFPAFAERTEVLSDGKTELHLFRSELPGGSSSIAIGYNDLSESTASRPAQELLEAMRDGALKEAKGTPERQENLTVKGRPAMSVDLWVTDEASGTKLYCRWVGILQPRRAYNLTYVTTDEAKLDSQEVRAFFNSFVLLD